jgi:hypothetical protein
VTPNTAYQSVALKLWWLLGTLQYAKCIKFLSYLDWRHACNSMFQWGTQNEGNSLTVNSRFFFPNDSTTPWGPRPPHFSRLHDHKLLDTLHSVGLLWTRDQPVAETSTWQHTTHKRQTSIPSGFFFLPVWGFSPLIHFCTVLNPFVLHVTYIPYYRLYNKHNTNIHVPGGIWTHNLSKREAVDPRLRPHGHWDRLSVGLGLQNAYNSKPVTLLTDGYISDSISYSLITKFLNLSLNCGTCIILVRRNLSP